MLKKIVILFISLFLIIGCNNSLERKSSLKISLDVSRNISPDLAIASYTVSGTRENSNDTFSENFDNPSSLLITDLNEGKWAITVVAKNVAQEIILTGEGSGELEHNATTNIPIDLNPLPGEGKLDLTVTWSGLGVPTVTPEIKASLEPTKNGEIQSITFNPKLDKTGSVYVNYVTAGTYIMSVELIVNGEKRGGITEVVTVAQDLLTQGTLDIPIDFRGAISGLTITTDVKSDLPFTLSGNLNFSNTTTINATPTDVSVDFQYSWYINGVKLPNASGNAITIDNTIFKSRNAILSCVVVSNALNKVSAKSIVLTYNEAPTPGKITIAELVGQNEINLIWNKATDDVTPQGSLVYKLIKGSSLDSLKALSNPDTIPTEDVLMDWGNENSFKFTIGFQPDYNYYYKVFVKDSHDCVTGYTPILFNIMERNPMDYGDEIQGGSNEQPH